MKKSNVETIINKAGRYDCQICLRIVNTLGIINANLYAKLNPVFLIQYPKTE